MANKVWVFVDQFKGDANQASWEAIGAGKMLAEQLGGGVTALVFGSQVENIAEETFHYGADEVILANDATLAEFRAEPVLL